MNIADLHCDTISRIYQGKLQKKDVSLRSNPFHLDLEKMKHSGYLLQNFAIFVDFQESDAPFADCLGQIGLFQEEMEGNKNLISPVTTYEEIIQNQQKGKISALLTLEEGELCQGALENLRSFYGLGIRMMTFTWNYPNSLGYPAQNQSRKGQGATPYGSHCQNSQGLTSLGIEFLEEMEYLGIIPDVSHLSDDGIRDVCRLAKKPFCASHSNARALCPHPRNLPDTLIRSIGAHGGIIGANYYGPFLSPVPNFPGQCPSHMPDAAKTAPKPADTPTGQYRHNTPGIAKETLCHSPTRPWRPHSHAPEIAKATPCQSHHMSTDQYYSYAFEIANHIQHISNIGGISCIGLGSDFDGFHGNLEIKDCSYMELLEQALRKKGFHENEIEKIFYKNVLEFYQEVL